MIINPYAFGQAFDPDAQAFFTASGLTGSTNLTAINNLVVALKGFGIWTKMKAIYPMIGGTAALHKWNLKDPRDLDAAFRLVFSGGWTHSSTGALPNGTNGYADTKLNMSTNYSVNDNLHLSFYTRTLGISSNNYELGCLSGGIYNALIISRSGFGTIVGLNTTTSLINADVTGQAFYIASRIGTTTNSYRNLILSATNTTTAQTRPNLNLFMANTNDNGGPNAGLYSNKECSFSSIGDGLNATEAANFYTAVQAYQTTNARQV